MTYRAPVADMAFTMRHVAGLSESIASGLYADLTGDLAVSILEEAAKFAGERLAPLNHAGDKIGAVLKDGAVKTPPGWKQAYADWAAAGWGAVAATTDHGGQGLPVLLNIACTEMWNAANMAFSLNPLLTMGAVEALTAHASGTLKKTYLAKMISGEWTGTMNLTESSAGSDLSVLRSKAVPAEDGSYRITGQKIFITYGEHDLTENIVHLVLARLPDAPAGTRGISLFLVPKFLVNADGSLGARNDVRCHSIEHKLGIHASPTCTMVFGDQGGAVGYLVGEENRGLNCMFTMMNNARLAVGVQGVAIAERAYQQALHFARERRQGKALGASGGSSPLIEHPDVKRMLAEMRAKTQAARAICYATAAAIDRAQHGKDRAAHEEAGILTPVAKAYSTDIGIEVASLGVQIHGGMGFVEETGAAQHYRDARILPIYEGTNGIQSIDLVMRKLPLSGGAAVAALIQRYRAAAAKASAVNDPAFGATGRRAAEAVEALARATDWMLAALGRDPAAALAGATPYQKLFGAAAGAAYLAEAALAAHAAKAAGDTDPAHHQRIAAARAFAENIAVLATGLEAAVVEGSSAINEFTDAA